MYIHFLVDYWVVGWDLIALKLMGVVEIGVVPNLLVAHHVKMPPTKEEMTTQVLAVVEAESYPHQRLFRLQKVTSQVVRQMGL